MKKCWTKRRGALIKRLNFPLALCDFARALVLELVTYERGASAFFHPYDWIGIPPHGPEFLSDTCTVKPHHDTRELVVTFDSRGYRVRLRPHIWTCQTKAELNALVPLLRDILANRTGPEHFVHDTELTDPVFYDYCDWCYARHVQPVDPDVFDTVVREARLAT
jgi:hypothetical protein